MDLTQLFDNRELAVSLAVGFLIPAAVAFVTKRLGSNTLKSGVLVALSALSAVLVQATTTNDYNVNTLLTGFFVTFISAVSSHYGFLKPVGITGTDGAIQTVFPGGVGKVVPEYVAPLSESAEATDADALAGEDVQDELGVGEAV